MHTNRQNDPVLYLLIAGTYSHCLCTSVNNRMKYYFIIYYIILDPYRMNDWYIATI